MDQELEKLLSEFDDATAQAIRELIYNHRLLETKADGKDLIMVVENNGSCSARLVFKNVQNPLGDQTDYASFDFELLKEETTGKYHLIGSYDTFDEDEYIKVDIIFDSAELRTEVYSAVGEIRYELNPWEMMIQVCSAILSKAEISESLLNQQEKKLIPLMEEVTCLTAWGEAYLERKVDYSILKAMAEERRLKKTSAQIGKLVQAITEKKRTFAIRASLFDTLSLKENESLWRDIWQQISESQSLYPQKSENSINRDELLAQRKKVEVTMAKRGYVGEYPVFYKMGELKGYRNIPSNGDVYTIFNEKRMQSIIYFSEIVTMENKAIIFPVAATAFLKKQEQLDDVYGCMFNAEGRRIISAVPKASPVFEEEDSTSLSQKIDLACKIAQCIILTKEEKRSQVGRTSFNWGMMLFTLVLGGGFFGGAMTLWFTLLLVIFGLFDSELGVAGMLQGYPWYWVLLFGGLGFGLPMGIIYGFANRK